MSILLTRAPIIANLLPPLGIAYISAALKENGYNTKLDDLNMNFCNAQNIHNENLNGIDDEQTQKAFFDKNENYFINWAQDAAKSGADVVGFSVWMSNIYITSKLSEIIKQQNPEIKIVCGGPNSDNLYGALKNGLIDVIVLGEGEQTFLEVLERWHNGKSLHGVAGIRFSQDVTPIERAEISDINTLPFPDFSEIKLDKYIRKRIPMLFSRGCSWNCKFCNEFYHWKKYRSRSAENIFNEILLRLRTINQKQYHFHLFDCAYNQNVKMIEELCDKIISLNLPEGTLTLSGMAQIRGEITFPVMQKMHKAGLSNTVIGVESGCDRVLKLMNKPTKVAQIEKFLESAFNAGMPQPIILIAGFPGETEADWDETLNFVERVSAWIDNVAVNYMTIPQRLAQLRFADIVNTHIEDPLKWHSLDMQNTYETRVKRVERFHERLSKLPNLRKVDDRTYFRVT